jgi:hypothetical protein
MIIDIYLHSDKCSVYDKGEAAGLKGEALDKFMYAGYEEKLTYEVDANTGEYTLVKVNDRVLL